MSIKYICDVCGYEDEIGLDYVTWSTSEADFIFDICEKCSKKMFKSVKRYRATVVIEVAK